MGLMEKALQYRSELNKQGHSSVMDRIPGPAETVMMPEDDEHDDYEQPVDEQTVDNEIDMDMQNESESLVESDLSFDNNIMSESEEGELPAASDFFPDFEAAVVENPTSDEDAIDGFGDSFSEDDAAQSFAGNVAEAVSDADDVPVEPLPDFDEAELDTLADAAMEIFEEEIPALSAVVDDNSITAEDHDLEVAEPALRMEDSEELVLSQDDLMSSDINDVPDSAENLEPVFAEISIDNDDIESEILPTFDASVDVAEKESIPDVEVPFEDDTDIEAPGDQDFTPEETSVAASLQDELLEHDLLDISESMTEDDTSFLEDDELPLEDEPSRQPVVAEPVVIVDDSVPLDDDTILLDLAAPDDDEVVRQQSKPADKARPDKKFRDFMILFETGKELFAATDRDALFDTVLFSIMGQVGAASAAIILPIEDKPGRWYVHETRGVRLKTRQLTFAADGRIMRTVLEDQKIVDLDDFKSKESCREEYELFLSIDACMICPVVLNGEVQMLLTLGEKITIGEYVEHECDYVRSVLEVCALSYDKLQRLDVLQKEHDRNQGLDETTTILRELENDLGRGIDESDLQNAVQNALRAIGVKGYAFYTFDAGKGRYFPVYVEKEDFLGLKQAGITLDPDCSLVTLLTRGGQKYEAVNVLADQVLVKTFGEQAMARANHFVALPRRVNGILQGFLALTVIDHDRQDQVIKPAEDIARIVFSSLAARQSLALFLGEFNDYFSPVYNRLELELKRASGLECPLTIVVFALKNHRRFAAHDKEHSQPSGMSVVGKLADTLNRRLSESDFMLRLDRHMLLVVMPGRTRDHAVTLASAARNEVTGSYRNMDVQPMITYLTAMFPDDGTTPDQLLDMVL